MRLTAVPLEYRALSDDRCGLKFSNCERLSLSVVELSQFYLCFYLYLYLYLCLAQPTCRVEPAAEERTGRRDGDLNVLRNVTFLNYDIFILKYLQL